MKTLPEDFIQYTQKLMGDELFQQLKQGITEGEAPTSIRINPFKCKEGEDAAGEPIPWCPSTGRYLSTRPNFTFDPWLHAGKYYVQEASSMFVDLVIRQLVHEPVMMLDLCAAPGGKSTAVRAALPEGSLLFSNEPMRTRSQILAENLLIYSTCTFNAHEDEENIAWICEELGADPIALNDIDEAWNITGNLIGTDIPVYRFLPGKTRGEGIFLAVLRKEGEPEIEKEDKKKKKDKNKDKGKNRGNKGKNQQVPTDWLKSSDYETIAEDENFYAIPSRWKAIYEDAARNLKVIHAGIKLGTSKGKDIIPDQSLALSTELNTEVFPQVELSYEDAIRYLRKEAVNLPADTPKGYVLVTYQQMPLGWEKNIGNRANNLYPQEWKIKSSHVPEEPCVISKK